MAVALIVLMGLILAPIGTGRSCAVYAEEAEPADAANAAEPSDASDTADEIESLRYWGNTRYDTSFAVAEELYELNGTFDNVVLAYGGNFPDCISGGILAHFMNAPILYGDSKVPTPYVNAAKLYVQNYQIHVAYVLGGTSLVSDQFIIDLLTY